MAPQGMANEQEESAKGREQKAANEERKHKTGAVTVADAVDVWVPHDLTQKNIFDRMDACESLLNRNKIDPILKRMVTGDEKWITYDNVKRKQLWSKSGEAAQTVAKPGLTARKVICVFGGISRESSTMSCSPMAKRSIRTCTGPLECSTHAEESIFDQQRPNCLP
ncbi:uncharacterized protein LOC127565408 [Drosophila albomicans]|uniref:Uncharacterized protein LOC127565408 n=1 Tax=Drosophila albomicans TaxID=7291 RepID=A0A9C6WDY5_DROAB|nr:uncharacterized protein LOC127565408 [Drosophila albomicans]